MKKQEKELAKKSLIKQTVAWLKEIPHKLEVLLNNLWTLAFSVSALTIGAYMIADIVPNIQGYPAVGALIASAVIAVGGGANFVHFLLKRGE